MFYTGMRMKSNENDIHQLHIQILVISLSCFVCTNKVFPHQNCQLCAFTVIFNALSIFLIPRKYLTQSFEITTTAQMEKTIMPLIYVGHNCFPYWSPRVFFFFLLPASYREQLWPVFDIQKAKRMFKIETIFHLSLVF